jgi:hypothetical protein
MATMSAEDNQYSISMSYDTCGEDEADAVRTMLAAIEARSSVFVTVHKDGVDEPIFEDEICAFGEALSEPETRKSRLVPHAREFLFYLTDEEAEALNKEEWQALDDKLRGLGLYDTDFLDDRIIFGCTEDMLHMASAANDTIAEELDRMTGRTTQAALEEIAGFGSF